MEALRKLEEEQKMLLLMQSRGFTTSSINSHCDSDRFLAQFLLFLIQPCGELDMDKKCHLISQSMPKMSASFLEEASLWLHGEGCQQHLIRKHVIPNHEDKIDYDPLQTDFEDIAMVGLDAMQRANSTLEDFCRSYFMFHEMDVSRPQSIFRYLPVLSFTESYIYQLDSLNEKMVQIPADEVTLLERRSEAEANQHWNNNLLGTFRTYPFSPLILLLEHHGLCSERIREEFRFGEEYWGLERKLCSALMSKKEISIEDAMRAIHLKSFDYRVLNLLLYQLRSEKVNELHMEFLSISEFLVEISDDFPIWNNKSRNRFTRFGTSLP
ncbi:uncharacterized protein LOC131159587 isoform X2 [Malania oleifera]|uniref:uncharacterized protein LOC131159587 isoform X2 n=1 Tax=Malania oleifera TaxID=397392 RepID=UPI0025ADCB23|nr:uncharacterized protein LOC131159587 isoform X2 [Malania oleifera]